MKPVQDRVSPLGPDLPDSEDQLFQIDSFPVFDQDEAIGLIGSESEMINVLEMSIDQIFPEELTKLNAAYDKKDWEKIREVSHKLKGGSLYCGTKKMTMACQYMERYYKAGHRKLLEELYQQLIATIKETEIAVRSILTT